MTALSANTISGSSPINWSREKNFGNPFAGTGRTSVVSFLVVQHVFSADYSITPRPLYGSDGNKVFSVHSQPLELRHKIKRIWKFPPLLLGPDRRNRLIAVDRESARWIERHQPDLSLVYLPHLDYDLQRFGPNDPRIKRSSGHR